MNAQVDLLDAATRMGAVTLFVADLDAMVGYYQQGVGLTLQGLAGGQAVLGRNGSPVLNLVHQPSLKHAPAGHAGLFHTAILFDQEVDLAAALLSIASRYPGSYTGSADHLVSKAFYFDDPEGNGLELYWDRSRDLWTWQSGQIKMASLALDPNAFIRTNLPDLEVPGSLSAAPLGVGHVHLKVGSIGVAKEFYVQTLGFEETAAVGDSALFVSAGGYHHHAAMNTWQSNGAGPRFPALGLGQLTIEVPQSDDVLALAERLTARSWQFEQETDSLAVRDPWENLVLVRTTGSAHREV